MAAPGPGARGWYQDGFLQVWRPTDTNNAARQLTMRGYPSKVNCLAWHPRRTVIATAGGPDIVLWDMPVDRTDTKNGSAKGRPLRHHQATVTAIAWSADGRLFASGDRNGRLCIWDENGDAVFPALGSEITVVQWHPVNAVLSVADGDGRLHLVDRLQSDRAAGVAAPGAGAAPCTGLNTRLRHRAAPVFPPTAVRCPNSSWSARHNAENAN